MADVVNMQKLKEAQYALEEKTLSPYAALSKNTKGRLTSIPPCSLRTDFVRDRDRIIHCKSFRRLKHKTQVFLTPSGDHFRTRLTHTLEVSQIARTISRALKLNEDLTEAIALGHDLGHTPFGHAGEAALNKIVSGGFEHNVHGIRVVDKLEGGTGLNLTYEVRDGILNHRKSGTPQTLEAAVVSISDRIAYINHDIDDAIRAGVLSPNDLPQDAVYLFGTKHGDRINSMICDVINESFDKPFVRMSGEADKQANILRSFMFENVYLSPAIMAETDKAAHIVRSLYEYYITKVELLPEEFKKNIDDDGEARAVSDYVACMTDRYAISAFERIFIPSEHFLINATFKD